MLYLQPAPARIHHKIGALWKWVIASPHSCWYSLPPPRHTHTHHRPHPLDSFCRADKKTTGERLPTCSSNVIYPQLGPQHQGHSSSLSGRQVDKCQACTKGPCLSVAYMTPSQSLKQPGISKVLADDRNHKAPKDLKFTTVIQSQNRSSTTESLSQFKSSISHQKHPLRDPSKQALNTAFFLSAKVVDCRWQVLISEPVWGFNTFSKVMKGKRLRFAFNRNVITAGQMPFPSHRRTLHCVIKV